MKQRLAVIARGFALAAALILAALPASQAREKEGRPANFKAAQGASEGDAGAPVQHEAEVPPARRAIERESFYDPENPDLDKLQKPEEVTRNLPFDGNGFPDWMKALREGKINPRMSLRGNSRMEVLDMDVIMRNTREMPNVRFPHRSHTLWLDCSNCHPEPFKPQAGSNAIRMPDIFRGQFCGKCHDRVAFITFFSCSRCHSVPQGTAAAADKPR